MKVAIIGAGISGLASAFYLQKARPDCSIQLFDALPQPGGTMQTVEKEGFRFEAGGNGFLTNKPDSLRLVEDCGAQDLLVESSDAARKRFIFTDKLHRLPESPPAFLKTALLSWPQKLRVLSEVVRPAKSKISDESLRDFGYRRLGKGFTNVFLDAMVAGIYATTPDKVSVSAAFPLVAKLEQEHGGLFRGMLAKRKKSAGPGGKLFSFKHGVGSFIAHLADQIDADWHLNEWVSRVRSTDHGYRVETQAEDYGVDQVILATPAYASANLLRAQNDKLAELFDKIDYSPIAVVGLGFKSLDHPLDGFGLLTTASAQLPILGVLWDSSIFPHRAPEGAKTLRIMIGGQRNPELVKQSEEALLATARRGLQATLDIDAAPDVTFIKKWPRGIPSYPVGHLSLIEQIYAQIEQYPGLHLCNNAFQGIAMNDCVHNARVLAEKILCD